MLSLYSVSSTGGIVVNGDAAGVPVERINEPMVIALGAGTSNDYRLKRGQFRVTFRVQRTEETEVLIERVRNQMLYVNTEDGPKRLHAYYITAGEGQPADGEETVAITATFVLLDNPIWLVPALWAVTSAVGVIGGWFLIDKVETFSSTGIGAIITVAAAAMTAFVLYKTL